MERTLQASRDHYLVTCRLYGRNHVLIWYTGSDDELDDGLVVDDKGCLVWFSSEQRAREYAAGNGLTVDDAEPVLYNLDELTSWLASLDKEVDCVATLNFWNLFSDVAASVPMDSPFRGLDRAEPDIYEKIFVGNNLRVMTPPREHYVPIWSDDEMRHIVAVMASGLELLESALPDMRPN